MFIVKTEKAGEILSYSYLFDMPARQAPLGDNHVAIKFDSDRDEDRAERELGIAHLRRKGSIRRR